MGKYGGANNLGEFQPEQFLDQNALNKAASNQQRTAQEATQVAASDSEVKNLIGSAYQGSKWTRWANDNSQTPPLSKLGGTRIEFQKDNDDNIVIHNWDAVKTQLKSLGVDARQIIEEEKKVKTPEGLFKFIKQYGGSMKKTSIKKADIPNKAAASGYTPEEYMELLKQKGIQIEE